MRARLLIMAVTGLSLAAAGAAEPAKAPVQKAAQPDSRPAEVVVASASVASASDVRPETAAATPDGAPVKRVRKARVNSCRCGDQPQGD